MGLTCDLAPDRQFLKRPYVEAVRRAGGIPILLPSCPELAEHYASLCHALVLTGGDDPRTEPFGEATHPNAVALDPRRQAMELALLDLAADRPTLPVLGICLGMQLMALHAGGAIDQHLPESLPTHSLHRSDEGLGASHQVRTRLFGRTLDGVVLSHHRQAVRQPGSLEVVGRAPDGVIECICEPRRSFFLGVQWHPERTADPELGDGLFAALVAAANSSSRTPG